MKRILIGLLIGWCVSLHAANQVTLSTANGSPGDTVTLTVNLSNTDAISAIEIIIPTGEYISYVPASAILNSARSNGHSITASQVGKEMRVYIYSLSLQPLQGNEGELFSCRLALSNEPVVQNLTPTVVMSDANGAAISGSAAPASLTIIAPKMEVQTPSIDYGHIPIRATYTKPLTIRNTGTAPLTISAIDFSAEEFTHAALPIEIAAGGSQSITLTYAPTQRGAIQESATITSDAVNGQFVAVKTVSLVADPFSVNELHVGHVAGVVDDTVQVPITMNNMEPIVAGEVSFKMPKQLIPAADGFTLSSRATDHQTIMRIHGDTATYYFFSPTNSPLKDNDGELGTIGIIIDGSSSYYYLKPIQVVLSNASMENMVSATSQGYVQAQSPRISTAANLSLPSIAVTDTATATFSISNNGAASLTVDKITFLQEGFACITPLPLTIDKYTTGSIEVQYIPTKEGKYSTTMQIYSNDPAERMRSVNVSDSVYEPNELTLTGQQIATNYMLSVSLTNYSEITAMQFDINGLPEANVNSTNTDRLAQHSVMLVPLGEGVYRVIVYSMNNVAIGGHNGEILQLYFPIGDLSQISSDITNIVLSTPDGKNKNSSAIIHWDGQIEPVIVTNIERFAPNTSTSLPSYTKVLRNGQILLERNNATYTPMGQKVK